MSNSFQDKLERGRGRGGLISGLAYNQMYFFCCLQEDEPRTGGAYKLGRGL